jgi:hypothetical protein
VRHFQAEADRARTAAADAERRATQAEADLQAATGSSKAIADGAAAAIQQAMQKAQEAMRMAEAERGERLKAMAIAERPYLRDYAALIPATTDEAQLAQYVATFEAARTKDLETQKVALTAQIQAQHAAATAAATPATPTTPSSMTPSMTSVWGQLPPTQALNALNPATPASSGGSNSVATPDAMKQALDAAMERADAEPNPMKRAQIFQEEIAKQAAIGQTFVSQQLNR